MTTNSNTDVEVARQRFVEALQSRNPSRTRSARHDFIEALHRTYRARLPDADRRVVSEEYVTTVRQLLAEWNPIGFELAEATQILGRPTEQGPSHAQYSYVTPRGGLGLRLQLQGERELIVGVQVYWGH